MKNFLPIPDTNTRPLQSFSFLLFLLLAFTASAQDQPPYVTADGNQIYCPGTPMNIVTAFNITDPDDTGTDAIYIQISSGYVNGQDFLSLPGAHPNITSSWNAPAGKLVLQGVGGDVPYTDLIAAVEDVIYTNTSATPSGSRSFSITVGEANYLPSTGHYYKFVPQLGISWTASKTAAEASNYYGLQGYLATLLSAEEAQLCGEQAAGNGWIGGSDSQAEGVWRWMTGPEAGIVFWNGGVGGSTPNFAFWNSGEPNNSGGDEDYAHVTAPGIGIPGSWNDLPNGGSSGAYTAQGYIVEFGGMPGDPILHISASTTISFPKITATTPASRCGNGTLTLAATADFGATVHWYTTATGATEAGTGTSFTTPALTATTTYYASPYDSGCTTAARTAVVATINPIPTITSSQPTVTACNGSAATLQATPSAGTVSWYTSATSGTPVSTGTSFTTPAITANTSYFAEAVSPEGCVSATRAEIAITVTPIPTITATDPAPLCGSGTATLQATPSAGTVNWYTSATGGTAVGTSNSFTTPSISATTTYYAEAVNGSCTSAARQPVTVTVNPQPSITSTTNGVICEQGSTTLSAAASGATINWYDSPTGGTLLATGPDYTTPVLTATTNYYAEAVSPEGCVSAVRTSIEAQVLPLPTATVTTPVEVCGQSAATLEGVPSAGVIEWYDAPTGGNLIGTGNSIQSPVITANTTFYAEAVNNGCHAAAREAVQVNFNPLPAIGPDEEVVFCENGDTELDAGITGVTYLWSTGQTSQTITVDEPGTYSVVVTSPSGCTATRTFTATTLTAPDIRTVAINTDVAVIIMANNDPENYLFSVDGSPYQDLNQFPGMTNGYHTASALSRNGCGEDFFNFVVYLIPKFFSPNGDNVNDVFTLAGMYTFPEATVDIFDRYGKLITRLSRKNRSWDGTYNGYPLPATDYWYVVKIDDATPEIRGHFSLMR